MSMLKVGFVDDENTNYVDYATRLRRHNIEMLFYEGESSVDAIIEWLISEEILCLFVDYDLQKKFTQNGTDLVFSINQLLPDFPCIMLTNYPEQSKNEKIVPKRLIWDREKMSEFDLSEVIDTINNEVEVYLKRKTALSEEYARLVSERNTPLFTASDEERLMQLHALFSKYGETDDLPSPLLSSETNKKLDSLINRLTQLVEKKEE